MFWISHLEGAPKRVNHAAVAVGNFIYSFGGYCKDIDFTKPTPISIHKLNTVTYRWKEIVVDKRNQKLGPFQRYGHTAVTYGTNVIVWGGRNDLTPCSKVFCFDTVNNVWVSVKVSGDAPPARDGHSACVIGDYMYVTGGMEDATEMHCNDLYGLNLKTMEWEHIKTNGERPAPREFHVAAAIGSRMYIYGGIGESDSPSNGYSDVYWSDISYLDTRTLTWYQPVNIGDVPIGRRSCSSFVYNDHIFIFGGCNGIFYKHFNDLHSFNPKTNEWRRVNPVGIPPSTRRRQCCVVVNNCAFIFGGSRPKDCDISEEEGMFHAVNADHHDLVDLSDLHVLQLGCPSLKTLCIMKVIKEGFDYSVLPKQLQRDIWFMVTPDVISSESG